MPASMKCKGKMKYQYDKELAHACVSYVSSPLDQVSKTEIGHFDIADFLQRVEAPSNSEMRHIKRSNIHLVSTFPMAAFELEFVLGCARHFSPKTKKIKDVDLGSGVSYLVERLRLKQIMQPPIVASILAMVIGGIPILKSFILTNDAPLFFVTDSCIILGGAMIPCIMLALGGNLVGGPGSSELGWKTTVAIIVARLFFVPPVGLGIVTLADKLGFLPPNDKMFRFVLLLQHTMPTSVLSGAVANIRGFGVKEAAAVLFWVHICAIFSMAIWIILYLRILL